MEEIISIRELGNRRLSNEEGLKRSEFGKIGGAGMNRDTFLIMTRFWKAREKGADRKKMLPTGENKLKREVGIL
jgi:hypothetical protein